uniref:Bm1785, isoform b n=2 Tax=Brugia malayi TaxID=6279 RepID=A0A1I9G1H2_BRUMA|nr:Bm1785, isoform b [Brugia malayi]
MDERIRIKFDSLFHCEQLSVVDRYVTGPNHLLSYMKTGIFDKEKFKAEVMSATSINGFCLFAQELQIKIAGRRYCCQDDIISPYLVRIVTPLWERLTSEEKKVWKDRAKMKRHIEEYFALMHQPRMLVKRKKREHEMKDAKTEAGNRAKNEKLNEFDENDYPEDSMIGVPLNQKDYDSEANGISRSTYQEKYEKDKKRVLVFLRTLNGLDEIRRARFLFISVQTYGNVDGICIPAEIAICEFNLKHGIIDKYTSIIGPWRLNNEIQRRRAEFHANETHQIHLDMFGGRTFKVPTQNSCLKEILGRCEPTIAHYQGVFVGLYRDGIAEFDSDVEQQALVVPYNCSNGNYTHNRKRPQGGIVSSGNGCSSRTYTAYHSKERRGKFTRGYADSHYYGSKCPQQTQPIFVANKEGRRWLVCLNHEYEKVRASLEYLKKAQRLSYDGFPTTEDRFWYADAVVDALAEYANGTPNLEYKLWMDIFGKRQPFEFNTPWERRANVFCQTHSVTRNCCCASATAIRSCFAMFFALRELLDLTLVE